MKSALSSTLSCLALAACALGSTIAFNANVRQLVSGKNQLRTLPLQSTDCLQYDNLAGAVAGPTDNSVGIYDDIIYNSWIVVSAADSVTGGATPHSLPNAILTDSPLQTMNGTPSFTVAPPYKTFSLEDFWFGCDIDSNEDDVAIAAECTITVAAFTASSTTEVAVVNFTFPAPVNPLDKVPYIHAVLPISFSNVHKVTVIQDNPTDQGLGLDNLHYTVST